MRNKGVTWALAIGGLALFLIPWETKKEESSMPRNLPVIKRGSRGEAVAYWQGIIGVEADGIFGPITEAATKQYQTDHGLVADGIVGPLTWGTIEHASEPLRMSMEPPAVYDYKQIGPDHYQMVSTPLTRGQAHYVIREAFKTVEGRYPTDNELRMLAAHSALETGNWGSGLHNYNFGNFRGTPYFEQLVPEFLFGKWTKVKQRFKSFKLASDGAVAWLRVLKKNWPAAWDLLDSEDPAAYASALKNQGRIGGYYTAPESTYTAALQSRYA
jgi:hypothetical protein